MLFTVKTTGKHTIIVTFNGSNLVHVSYNEDPRKHTIIVTFKRSNLVNVSYSEDNGKAHNHSHFNGSNLVNVKRKCGKLFMTYIQDVLLNLDTLHTCDESITDIPQNQGMNANHLSNKASFYKYNLAFQQPMLGIYLAFSEVFVQRFG